MNSKGRVLIIAGTPIISGAEYVLSDYIKYTEHSWQFSILHSDISFVTAFFEHLPFEHRIKTGFLNPVGVTGGTVFSVLHKLCRWLLAFVYFANAVRAARPGLVLGNNVGDMIFSIYTKLFRRTHINYIHDMVQKGTFIAKMIKLFDPFVDRYLAVSNAVKVSLINIGIKEDKIQVIYNGLSVSDPCYKQIRHRALGFVGNIDDRKNPMMFLEFLNYLKTQGEHYSGKIVYAYVLDPELLRLMQVYVSENALDVEFHEKLSRDEMSGFYKQIDFLMVTSKRDPLPTVVLEAFNCCVPVIAIDRDGIPEMVHNEVNGFLFNSQSDFGYLLENIKKSDYECLQTNAYHTIKERFDLKLKVNALDDILFGSSK